MQLQSGIFINMFFFFVFLLMLSNNTVCVNVAL